MKCFGTTRGGRACFGEIVCARVSGTRLLHGKFEVNWLELVWLGKTENTEEYLYGDEHGVRKFWTIRRQPESARRGYVDKLAGDPFNPKPKTSMAVGRGELTCNGACETRYEVTEKRWYVTEGSGQGHGRTMGCPRCSSGIGMHNAECRGRIDGILLQPSRTKLAEEAGP